MNFVAWIIVGLLAGLFARWIVRDDKSGCLYTVAVGVLGALIGGALMQAAGKEGITNEFDLRSILVAAVDPGAAGRPGTPSPATAANPPDRRRTSRSAPPATRRPR